MKTAKPTWGEDWTVGLRVWVERAGKAVLGQGRLDLLEGIDRWHSISAAARQMGMSYRHAWLLVQQINEGAGEPLVVAVTGGKKGGGAELTPLGRWATVAFRQFHEQLRQKAAALLPRIVHPAEATCLHVAAAVSLEEVLGRLLVDFALHQPGLRVRAIFGASDELASHLIAGAPCDLFLAADATQFTPLLAAGLLPAKHKAVILATNHLAAVGRADSKALAITPADLAKRQKIKLAVADPSCPLGGYSRTYLESLGLDLASRSNLLQVDNSRAVLAAVRAGQAEVGLVYASDAVRPDGCRLLFTCGKGAPIIRHEAAILADASRREPTQRLLSFLTCSDAAPRWRSCGFEPISKRPD
jgi:molybdenum ABC transporter molybdate-binding protein